MDKITYEVIRNGLYAIAREMKVAMMRTSASPIIHSGGDASAAIFDADMQLVAQGNDIPTMMGSAVISTRASVEAIGVKNLRPGDVIISNDAYLGGGNHQPDVQMTRPVFVDGEIIAYTMTRGHWMDIGGATPGSFSYNTWDIFGEGIRIPPILLFRDDKPVQDVVTLITQNTRDPENRRLDMQAQYAGAFVGDRRITALVQRYGKQAFADTMREALDYSERLMRSHIQRLPDGVYEAEDFLEPVSGPGWPTDLIPIRVKITIAGDRMIFDYTGSAPQVRGGVNCPIAVTCNSTWYTVKALTDPQIPINQGCYRPIEIIAPPGSVLNCTYPASVVSGNTDSSQRVIDMLLTALSKAAPDRVVAQSHGAVCAGFIAGNDTVEKRVAALRRRYIAVSDVHPGGFGARPTRDGVSAVRVHIGNAGSQPIEHIERHAPVQIEEWALVPDSGGAGRYRGGCASRRTYRILYDEAAFSLLAEREHVAPQGLFGGKAGSTFNCTITRANGSTERHAAKGPQAVLGREDRVTFQAPGSGGYGDPRARPDADVLGDLLDGYVSPASAKRNYGLSYDPVAKVVSRA